MQTVTQRGEQDRHHPGGDEGDGEAAAGLEEGAEVADGQYVDRDNGRRQGALDEGAIDEEVYVPQAVAQDRHADTERDQRDETVDQRVPDQLS